MFSAAGKTAAAVSTAANYIEDVFSTWLYTGNGSTQTITNGIDVTGKGGLIWFKERASQGFSHALVDTARGNLSSTEGYSLASDTTDSQSSVRAVPTSSGFSLSGGSGVGPVNFNGSTYVSWTFRKQPKFFDVVTYTGNGATSRNISHSLGSDPGCIIVKRTSGSGSDWSVYHRSTGTGKRLILNQTLAVLTDVDWFASVTSTTFSVSGNTDANDNGETYVAYLFAHDAGGFGATGADNVISCGSFTTPSSGDTTVTLGYEPQWVLLKRTDSSTGGNWLLVDTMRGLSYASNGDERLFANLSNAAASGDSINPTATGFIVQGGADLYYSATYIYIAIRRGPMKTPTTGTSVFTPVTWTSVGGSNISTNFPVDMQISKRAPEVEDFIVQTRLIGLNTTPTNLVNQLYLSTNLTGGDTSASKINYNWRNNGFFVGDDLNGSIAGYGWAMSFQRAPGFFDVVCFTSTGSSTQAINHNLGVTPELIIEKVRNNTSDWAVQQIPANKYGSLNSTSAMSSWSSTGISAPTATVFSPAGFPAGRTEVAYLFASCPGVSKVGSYTGNGSSQTIDCGFTGGARMVLIKRTDSTGNWVLFDSARGIVAGNDPALYLNSSAAQLTTRDAVDADSTGFIVNQTDPLFLNVNGASYIFLAIA